MNDGFIVSKNGVEFARTPEPCNCVLDAVGIAPPWTSEIADPVWEALCTDTGYIDKDGNVWTCADES